jgi:signal peptidase II
LTVTGTQPRETSRRRVALPWLWALATTIAVLGLDQLSKAAVRKSIVEGDTRSVFPGLQLVDTRNRGVAFGFLPGRHTVVTVLVGLALLVLVVYFARNRAKPWIWLPTGMLLGGAFGNIYDRLHSGSVTDFIKLPLGWPPFNLADTAITLGVFALLIVIEGPRHPAEPEDR